MAVVVTMALRPETTDDSDRITNVLVAMGLLMVIPLAAIISYQFVPKYGGITGHAKPNPYFGYLTTKAKECQGDFRRLTLKDQEMVSRATRGRGPTYMAMAWGSMQNTAHKD